LIKSNLGLETKFHFGFSGFYTKILNKHMATYISILRGINVSGQKKIKMEALKALYESLGLKNIIVYIQSGNVIFESKETDIKKLTIKIEKRIKTSFGFDVVVFIKSKNDLQKIFSKNPFTKKDPKSIYITFLSDIPENIPTEEINRVKDKSEEFVFLGKEIFLFCPNGYGRTKLSNNFFEGKLKLSATTRNWNTINKLLRLLSIKNRNIIFNKNEALL